MILSLLCFTINAYNILCFESNSEEDYITIGTHIRKLTEENKEYDKSETGENKIPNSESLNNVNYLTQSDGFYFNCDKCYPQSIMIKISQFKQKTELFPLWKIIYSNIEKESLVRSNQYKMQSDTRNISCFSLFLYNDEKYEPFKEHDNNDIFFREGPNFFLGDVKKYTHAYQSIMHSKRHIYTSLIKNVDRNRYCLGIANFIINNCKIYYKNDDAKKRINSLIKKSQNNNSFLDEINIFFNISNFNEEIAENLKEMEFKVILDTYDYMTETNEEKKLVIKNKFRNNLQKLNNKTTDQKNQEKINYIIEKYKQIMKNLKMYGKKQQLGINLMCSEQNCMSYISSLIDSRKYDFFKNNYCLKNKIFIINISSSMTPCDTCIACFLGMHEHYINQRLDIRFIVSFSKDYDVKGIRSVHSRNIVSVSLERNNAFQRREHETETRDILSYLLWKKDYILIFLDDRIKKQNNELTAQQGTKDQRPVSANIKLK